MKKIISILITISLIFGTLTCVSAADKDIVIFYENDVHCATDGYAKIAALRNSEVQAGNYAGIVSAGDYIQGNGIGNLSEGGYLIDIMNKVGYDAVTIGNHEFDYGIPRLLELAGMLDAKVVSSNFVSLPDNKGVFDSYTIVSYGDTKVAYIGVTTPATLSSTATSTFLNENGEFIYDFSQAVLYETVQKSIDSAKADGADYIVALTHLGTQYVNENWTAQALVKNTTGLDVVLDGHSHSVVESMEIEDKSGDTVIISSTGTGFVNIGKLTISSDGNIKTELIVTAEYENTDADVIAHMDKILAQYKEDSKRVIGTSEVALNIYDEAGVRLVRNRETSIGDFCADAYRYVLGADIGVTNGGGIRASIDEGDITYEEISSMFPFGNRVCKVETSGKYILDLLEYVVMAYPGEMGGFLHVSGIKFALDSNIPTPVKLDENGFFLAMEGERRVSDVMILKDGKYIPLDPEAKYTVASHEYFLKDGGDGEVFFKDLVMLSDTGMVDTELVEEYLNMLGGVISKDYIAPQGRIEPMDADAEYIPLRKTFESMGAGVFWDASSPSLITVKIGDYVIEFYENTDDIKTSDGTFDASKVAYITDGVTYISPDAIRLCYDLYYGYISNINV